MTSSPCAACRAASGLTSTRCYLSLSLRQTAAYEWPVEDSYLCDCEKKHQDRHAIHVNIRFPFFKKAALYSLSPELQQKSRAACHRFTEAISFLRCYCFNMTSLHLWSDWDHCVGDLNVPAVLLEEEVRRVCHE